MADFSPHQQKIIKRYYDNLDTISLQKLGELVGDLYLAQGKKRQRPPRRFPMEPQLPRKRLVEVVLRLLHPLEEEVRSRRYRHADDGAEYQERQVAATPEELLRIGRSSRRCRWRSSGVRH